MNFVLLNLKNRAGIGSVVLHWNQSGRVERLEWLALPENHAANQVRQGPLHPALRRSCDRAESGAAMPGAVQRLCDRLERYFANGDPIHELPWDVIEQETWTPFQSRVYRALSQVPHGETRTYAWLARKIGSFGASRAVGQALRRNPLPLLIPCHRIVSTFSSSGALGGFMGASDPNDREVQLKRALLAHEQNYRNPVFSFLSASPLGAVG